MEDRDKQIVEEGRKAAVAYYTGKSGNSTNPYGDDITYDLYEHGWVIGMKQITKNEK